MDEWLVLAKTIVPGLEKALAEDRSGTLAADIVVLLKAVPGVMVPADAAVILDSDPALRERVATQISSLTEKSRGTSTAPVGPVAPVVPDEPAVPDEIAQKLRRLDAEFEKLEQARRFYLELQSRNAKHVWVNPALSIGITGGFILLVYIVAFCEVETKNSAVFNIILGAFATAFATVISFHFGSSIGSKDKDQDKRREAMEQASAVDAAAIARIAAT
ncbi:hypothetical protein [Rhizobium sp. 9140]|uniref:hypothetical protein n=1 Tax=Rhizobium sp. 9140 TaxID=1761900 RepID=UPI0007980B72|nr:hypothetical protein [Rhizobium sp. 9140]CZT35223.1 hypothetical protein GA0004734_00022350 [Rhizobium sp. 9140]